MSLFSRNSASKIFSGWKKGSKSRPPLEAYYIYILALMTGYLLSDLGILFVRPAMLPNQPPPMKPSHQIRQQFTMISQYDKIRERNIFNIDGKVPPPLTADGNENPTLEGPPVLSQLPLKLEGTLVHANPKKSVCTISGKSKQEAKAYMVDREIEGVAKIVKIERRRVVFRNLNSQRLEYIEIPKDSSVTFGVKNPTVGNEEIQRHGDFDFTMRRGDLNKYTSDLGSILQQARMVPNIIPGSGGRVDGFRFVAIQPNSIFDKLGFKAEDVIKGVNGEPVNSPTKAMELYNALKSDGHVEIQIDRNGSQQTLNYDIPD